MDNFRRTIRRLFRRKPKPLLIVILGDIALTGAALLVFALFHHVLPQDIKSLGVVSVRPGTSPTVNVVSTNEAIAAPVVTNFAEPTTPPVQSIQTAVSEATAEPQITIEPAVTSDPVGYFGTKFADKFIEGEPRISNENGVMTYVSNNVNITLTKGTIYKSQCYVADVYVRDISNLRTAFAGGKYGYGIHDSSISIAKENNAIVAVNGDYYGTRKAGVVIRNGELFRDKYSDMDVCVLYWDGTLATYSPNEFDAEAAMEAGAYQAWCFGPELLAEDGSEKTDFNTSVGGKNPRTAIGYYEPGHYCLVVVDGRSDSSEGMSMSELSTFMYRLGCVSAYNMDGGQTSVMICGNEVVSVPSNGGRETSDLILITE